MLSRRRCLQSIAAVTASLRARFRPSASPRQVANQEVAIDVPEWEALSKSHRIQPLVAKSDGIPVYGFGSVDILGVCPELIPGEQLQHGNAATAVKIKPKRSWEIKSNKIGATPPRTPRTWMSDFQPLRPVHLIDGNPETYWSSRGQTRTDVQPQWIRIDLPCEARVKAVRIVPRRDGQGWPQELTIKVSRDAWHWDTVHEEKSSAPPSPPDPQTFSFETRPVKQVWIIGDKLRSAIAPTFLVFSIAGVEVADEAGNNLALVSRGAGVTVSSTNQGSAGEKLMHDMLWPVHYDLGLKWVRVAYWDSVLNWHYAEQEKGKIVIDPLADETITETTANGINVVLCLAYGNWLYARQQSNRQVLPPYSTADKQAWVIPFEWPPSPTETTEHFQAWLRFVRTMVRHFRGRIRYFEIWNEQNVDWYPGDRQKSKTDQGLEEYVRLVKETVSVIRGEYPEATIMLGSTAGFDRDYITGCLKRGVGPLVDVIPWHPFYGTPQDAPKYRNYRAEVRDWKKVCESYGFKGEYMATESGWYAPYPPPEHPFGGGAVSELVKAKCLARYITMSVGLDLTTFWNTTWHHYIWWDLGLFRNSFSADPVSPTQPQAAYYVLRNLCTLLESVRPMSVAIEFSRQGQEFEVEGFRLSDGTVLAGIWLPEEPADASPHVLTDLHFPEFNITHASGIDVLNGVEQPLQAQNGHLPGMIIKDYPLFVRLSTA
jgi:hypothetical protein